jgi:hypothetical protein
MAVATTTRTTMDNKTMDSRTTTVNKATTMVNKTTGSNLTTTDSNPTATTETTETTTKWLLETRSDLEILICLKWWRGTSLNWELVQSKFC